MFGNAHYRGRSIGERVETVRLVGAERRDRGRSGGRDGVRLRSQPPAADRRGRALGAVRDDGVGRSAARCARRRGGRWPSASARSRCTRRAPGCVFQNPDPAVDRVPDGIPASAGALIDRAGLKGHGARRRQGIAAARQLHRERGRRDRVRHPAIHRALPRRGPSPFRRDVCARRSATSAVVRTFAGPPVRKIATSHDREILHEVSCVDIADRRRPGAVGAIVVGGNKNAALPLIAACLLTDEECVLTNVPRISDVEVMAGFSPTSALDVDGIGTSTLRIRCAKVERDEPQSSLVGRLRGSVLLLGPMLARRGSAQAGAARAATSRPAGRLPCTSARSRRWARGAGGRGPRPGGAERPDRGVDVPRGGVGHGHRNGAAGGGRRARRHRDPACRLRAARRRALPVPAEDGRRRDGRGHAHDSRRGRGPAEGRQRTSSAATTSRRGAGRWWRR